jgi:ABC-2 type transport system ATP-binding protein
MAVAERMCDFIFMIHKGQKVLDGTLENIQKNYGQDTIRIQSENGRRVLEEIHDIDKITDFGKIQELKMKRGADPQKILSEIMLKTRITKFELASPSLNDIFIRIARPEKEDKGE